MYHKAVSKCFSIYFLPLKLLILFKKIMINNKDSNKTRCIDVRILDNRIKGDDFFIKIQIINCRATYEAPLFKVITDYNFIESCEPSSLIKLGYFSKIAESNRIGSIDSTPKYKKTTFSLFNFIKKKNNENNIDINNYHYNFIELLSGIERELKLFIKKSNSVFNVPFNDFMLDKSLLENIYPPDLLRIGYQLCQLDLQEKRQPSFVY